MKEDIVIQQAEENLSQLKEEEVLSKIFEIKGRIEERPVNEWSIEGLVDHVFTLCKIMDNLSELKDYATLKAEATEEEHKSSVRDEYLKLKESGEKMTDSMAKAKAEQMCDSIKVREVTNKYLARVLNDLYRDCDRLINFTQTKVKSLVDGSIRNNIPNN